MTYMTKEEIWAAALRQSAVDLNCSPEDFGREHSVVVRSAPHAGARKYLSLPFFCDLVSYGGNVVASVAPEAEAAVRAYVERYAPEHCFETPNMNVLADALRPFGMRICFMAEYFLPDVSRMRQWDCGYALKVLGPADFAGLYRPEWSNLAIYFPSFSFTSRPSSTVRLPLKNTLSIPQRSLIPSNGLLSVL